MKKKVLFSYSEKIVSYTTSFGCYNVIIKIITTFLINYKRAITLCVPIRKNITYGLIKT